MIHETGAHAPILLPGVNGKIYVAILFATYWRIVTMNTVIVRMSGRVFVV